MERVLLLIGSACVAAFVAYGLYAAVAESGGAASVLTALGMLGVILVLVGTFVLSKADKHARTGVTTIGLALVALLVGYALLNSADAAADDPSARNVFGAIGMAGLALILGATAVRRARS
jgi:FtsH-binding integral membrane protein